MKSWKEVPHLFANGKFKWINPEGQGIGWSSIFLGVIKKDFEIMDGYKLIARPISDMSDEELKKCPHLVDTLYRIYVANGCYSEKELRTVLINRLNRLISRFDVKIYLLSIGVYPFNQDNPESVIWRYENKKK